MCATSRLLIGVYKQAMSLKQCKAGFCGVRMSSAAPCGAGAGTYVHCMLVARMCSHNRDVLVYVQGSVKDWLPSLASIKDFKVQDIPQGSDIPQNKWAATYEHLLSVCCSFLRCLPVIGDAQVRKIVPEDSTLCLDNGLYKVRHLLRRLPCFLDSLCQARHSLLVKKHYSGDRKM